MSARNDTFLLRVPGLSVDCIMVALLLFEVARVTIGDPKELYETFRRKETTVIEREHCRGSEENILKCDTPAKGIGSIKGVKHPYQSPRTD